MHAWRCRMSDEVEVEELEVTAEEREFAERLALSLETGRQPGGECAELVQAAQLLRSRGDLELDAERSRALRGRLVLDFENRSVGRRSHPHRAGSQGAGSQGAGAPRRRFPSWAWLPLPLALAGVLFLFGVERETFREAPSSSKVAVADVREAAPESEELDLTFPSASEDELTELGSAVVPSEELLAVQARALASSPSEPSGREARAALERELSRHRGRLLAALDARWR